MLDDQLGGELYWEGTSNPVSLQPFLAQFSNRLTHQYLLTVEAESSGKPELKPVSVTTVKRGVSLVAPSKVYLTGAQPRGAAEKHY
jgi:hypothetical protein